MQAKLGLLKTRKQNHNVMSIQVPMRELRAKFPKMGTRDMIIELFEQYGMKVTR